MKLDYVRGHMGGNLIVLLRGDQLPVGRELELAVKLIGPLYLGAHEAGILYRADRAGEIRVKIAEPTAQTFISACGGMTQVLGTALVETELGGVFGIPNDLFPLTVLLQTEGGPVKLCINVRNGRVRSVKTALDGFVRDLYAQGVSRFCYRGVDVTRAGKYLAINAEKVAKVYPQVDFCRWDRPTRRIISGIQHDFELEHGEKEHNLVLYDWRPAGTGMLRAVFPHYIETDFIEPSCGTGSVALGLAALEAGELPLPAGEGGKQLTLKIECGGGIELGGPDITELELTLKEGRVLEASFSHSNVEVTSVGQVWL